VPALGCHLQSRAELLQQAPLTIYWWQGGRGGGHDDAFRSQAKVLAGQAWSTRQQTSGDRRDSYRARPKCQAFPLRG
jgi:hypothetical protein